MVSVGRSLGFGGRPVAETSGEAERRKEVQQIQDLQRRLTREGQKARGLGEGLDEMGHWFPQKRGATANSDPGEVRGCYSSCVKKRGLFGG